MSGTRPIDMEKEWGDVSEFVSDLKTALDEEAKTIRETNFDQAGEFRKAKLLFADGIQPEETQVFVDCFDRVILPAKRYYLGVKKIMFMDGTNGSSLRSQKVVTVEPRFKGDTMTTLVVYLEDL